MKNTSEEFTFLSEKLKQLATIMVSGGYMEAMFMIGCLHSLCVSNSIELSEEDEEKGKT